MSPSSASASISVPSALVEHGSTIGKKVGRLVAKNHFRPVK